MLDPEDMPPSLASFAQYFRIGIEVGICCPDQARDWAFSIIDKMDEPPGEIIEVTWRKPLAALLLDLNDVKGEPDLNLVCGWLLGTLSAAAQSMNGDLGGPVRQAMQIARTVGSSDLYYIFDSIEDGVHLADSQTYGTTEECRRDFLNALNKYSTQPFVYAKM